ncbi:MAG: sulfide-dependent adenosine diphosphate thiazole synthase [Chloroflexota bacterium]|nr:sulfide-dependent adenosine diphosphate thiazole synthase [Chloroflexota bacterium]
MPLFHSVKESDVTRAIVRSYLHQLEECAESDVIIVGGGPSGLIAGKELAEAGLKVIILERNNYLGGGFWIGGYFMNKLTVREPAHEVLDELGVPYSKAYEGIYVASAPHACASTIAAACDAGVNILNLTLLEDIILHENNRVAGAVINWSPISHLPKELAALDPVPLESKVMIDATGHDAVVMKKLEKRGLIKLAGEGALWIDKSEDAIVENTCEVHPGLVVTGMAVGAVYGTYRMGPTFGAMLLSGKKAAWVTLDILQGASVS